MVEIEIHPVSLGFGQPDYELGFPTLARGDEAREILEDIAARSKPYGTAMTIEDSVGRVVLDGRGHDRSSAYRLHTPPGRKKATEARLGACPEATRMYEASSGPAARQAPRLFWWLVLLGAGAFYLVFILRTGFTVYGELYYTLFDDAMISMRYAQNLAAGHGLVWNPGEMPPVEGYTNLLWTLWMAAIHLLPLPLSKTSLVVMASGALILLAQGWVVAATARLLTGVRRSWAGLFAVFLTAFSFPLIYWTLRGMEVGFLALLASAGALLAFRFQEERRPAFLLGLALCLSALVLTRDDAIVIAGGLAAYAVLTAPGWRSRAGAAAVLGAAVALPKAIHLAFRWSFYGDVLPNTYYLKLGGSSLAERIGRGALTFGAVLTQHLLPLLAVAGLLLLAFRRGGDSRLRPHPNILAAEQDHGNDGHTIRGEVLRVEGNTYVVRDQDGKEVSMHTDQTTAKPVTEGDFIQANVNEQNQVLWIGPLKSTDRRNEHETDCR